MHLLVILIQQLLGLIPNKKQEQPEPVRVRSAQQGSADQQAFEASRTAEFRRLHDAAFLGSTSVESISAASLRARLARRAATTSTPRRDAPGTAPLPDYTSSATADLSPEARA